MKTLVLACTIIFLVLAGCQSVTSEGVGGSEGPGFVDKNGSGWGEGDEEGGEPEQAAPDPVEEEEEEEEEEPPDSNCDDPDLDGFGEGCVAGPDCDEGNKYLNVYCPPCDNGIYAGCACLNEGVSIDCYPGSSPELLGVGECKAGQQSCYDGHWQACLGAVEPAAEECDGKDNNCDGQIDEGVKSPCGNCDSQCDTVAAGPETIQEFAPDQENSDSVGLNLDGHLVLDSSNMNLAFIWVANSGEGTVSKLDTNTGNELGRYVTCGNPSRTSVDLYGDVWVACRADGGVAKILLDKNFCTDKDGDGEVETSEDLNGDGHISGGEMLAPGEDECVKFVTNPGGSCQRAIGVDKDNHAWVAEWNSQMLRRLHPDDGHVVQEMGIPVNAYGLVIDGSGIIWLAGRGGNALVRVDPVTGEMKQYTPDLGSFSPYGITLDSKGRVWTANCCCWHVAYRFDPGTETWAAAAPGPPPRGLAGSVDGRMYVANDETNSVAVVDSDSMQVLGQIALGGNRFPVGMAVDFEGYVWAVNQSSSSATKIDPETWNLVGEYPVGSSPYTYSDMTGYTLHNFTAPQGHYSTVIGGWEGWRVKWEGINVDAEIPEGSSIELEYRTAMSKQGLEGTAWQGPFGPYPPDTMPLDLQGLPGLDGQLLEIRVWLYSENKLDSPVVKKIQAKFSSDF